MTTTHMVATYKWRRCGDPTLDPDKHYLRFETRPQEAGQIVQASYAIDLQDCVVYRRVVDRGAPPGSGPSYSVATRQLDGHLVCGWCFRIMKAEAEAEADETEEETDDD